MNLFFRERNSLIYSRVALLAYSEDLEEGLMYLQIRREPSVEQSVSFFFRGWFISWWLPEVWEIVS